MFMEQYLDFSSVFLSAFQRTLVNVLTDSKVQPRFGQAACSHGCASTLKNGFGGKLERRRMMHLASHGYAHQKDRCIMRCSLMTMALIFMMMRNKRKVEHQRSIKLLQTLLNNLFLKEMTTMKKVETPRQQLKLSLRSTKNRKHILHSVGLDFLVPSLEALSSC